MQPAHSRFAFTALVLMALTALWLAMAPTRPSPLRNDPTGMGGTHSRKDTKMQKPLSAAERLAELQRAPMRKARRYAGQPPGVMVADHPSTGQAFVARLPGTTPTAMLDKSIDGIRVAMEDPCAATVTNGGGGGGSGETSCAHVGDTDFAHVVFAVLTDPAYFLNRTVGQLETWLSVPSYGVLLCFDDKQREAATQLFQESPAARDALRRDRGVEVVYVSPRHDEAGMRLRSPNAAWKNLPVLAMLHARYNFSDPRRSPRWVCIVDDDTFVLGPNVARALVSAERSVALLDPADSAPSLRALYVGHHVLRCPFCRNRAKQYWFVYGGNGIFLNRDAMMVLDPATLQRCEAKYTVGAGDERLGGCAKDASISVTRVDGGCEGYISALAEGATEFIDSSPYPFAFHRVTRSELYVVLWHLVRDHLRRGGRAVEGWDRLVTWPDIASWILLPSAEACAMPMAAPTPDDARKCLPLDAHASEWHPKLLDPKMKALEAYAKFKQQAMAKPVLKRDLRRSPS